MLTSDELKNAKLGQSFDSKDLERCCKAIYGGVAWPNKRPGFAVVVAMNRFEKYGTEEHEIFLLDEFGSADMYELVRWCGGADSKYNPSVWIGDKSNPTADQFIRELNRETHGHSFSIQRTRINKEIQETLLIKRTFMEFSKMIEWEDVKKAKLGESFDIRELKHCCKAIYGGVSFPGQREGFAVVVAMDRARHLDSHDVCLLDEYESFDIRELIRQCGVLNFKYRPNRWIGDCQKDAARQFILEMNNEHPNERRRQFGLSWTPLFDMEALYPYIMAEIKRLRTEDRRQLFLPDDSKILGYMNGIEESEITSLTFGDYPSIEALAFAVIAMRRWAEEEYRDRHARPDDDDDDYNRLSFKGLGLDISGW